MYPMPSRDWGVAMQGVRLLFESRLVLGGRSGGHVGGVGKPLTAAPGARG
jgi:hypothetical protein